MKILIERYRELEDELDRTIQAADLSAETATVRHTKESRTLVEQQMQIRAALENARAGIGSLISEGLNNVVSLIRTGNQPLVADLIQIFGNMVYKLFQPEGFNLEQFQSDFRNVHEKGLDNFNAVAYSDRLGEIERQTLEKLQESCAQRGIPNPVPRQ